MFYEKIRTKQDISYIGTNMLIKYSVQQQIQNGNVFGN